MRNGGGGNGGKGLRSPFDPIESVRLGEALRSLMTGSAPRPGLLRLVNGSSNLEASNPFALSGLINLQSSGKTTGVLSVSSNEASKLSSLSSRGLKLNDISSSSSSPSFDS